jgi:hypothetical protein
LAPAPARTSRAVPSSLTLIALIHSAPDQRLRAGKWHCYFAVWRWRPMHGPRHAVRTQAQERPGTSGPSHVAALDRDEPMAELNIAGTREICLLLAEDADSKTKSIFGDDGRCLAPPRPRARGHRTACCGRRGRRPSRVKPPRHFSSPRSFIWIRSVNRRCGISLGGS